MSLKKAAQASKRSTNDKSTFPVAGATALLLAIYFSMGTLWGAPLPNAQGTGKAARSLVKELLRNPAKLRLAASPKSKRTFYFRIQINSLKPNYHFSLLVACNAGRVVVVTYDHNGRVYSYYTSGLFAIVDTRRPGDIDVFRGASMVLGVGGRAGGPSQRSEFGFAMAPVLHSPARATLDLSGPLQSALTRPVTWCGFQAATGTAVFYRKDGMLSFQMAKPKSAFPIRSVALSNASHDYITVTKINGDAQPLLDVFGVTFASLKAGGQPLRVRKYHFGEQLPWFPPPSFGSNQGEILASDALGRLMPIDENRARALDEHLISRQISALRRSGNSDVGPKSGVLPMVKIFSTLEWGLHNAVDFHAQRTVLRDGHPVYGYFSWKFDRTAYHKLLEKTWGTEVMDRLIRTLVGVALGQERGPAQKFAALDLLSDIGPGKADRQWANDGNIVSKVFARHKGNRNMSNLLLGLIRARWGLPVRAKSIAVAKRWLVNPKVNIPLRVRALEILCFTGRLPDDRHRIAELEKAYLTHPGACIAAPVPGRYLYDLSLCRTGRKILLEELTDRHSLLSGEPLLRQAAFNDISPGSPGFNLAVETAASIANDPKYSPALRKAAFYVMDRAPMPVFQKFMLKKLGENPKHFAMRMESLLTSRKAAEYFIPQLAGLFARGDDDDKVRILEAISYGFAKGSDANAAEPIISAALENADALVRWQGVGCIEGLKYACAKLNVTPLYPILVHLVKDDFQGNLWEGVVALNCLSLATNGRWKMPAAVMMANGQPDLQPNSGMVWWQAHYAAVRISALAWAARHKAR